MQDTNFYFNGKYSSDIGVYMVNLDSGLRKTPFLADREIISESIPNNPIPYDYGVQYKQLQFPLVLSCLDGEWTIDKRREIARWLSSETYEEFYTESEPEKRLYLMYQGGIDLTYDGAMRGYIEVQMLNISPFAYSPYYTKDIDCSFQDVTTFTFENAGDDILKPELEIYKVGAGDITIINSNNGGNEFKFTGLADKETIYIDNENHYIESDIGSLRYDNFNHNYLEFVRGVNHITVTGKCRLVFRYQFVIKG